MHTDSRWLTQKRDFDRDGFVVVRRFLDDAELATLGDNLARYIRDVVPRLPPAAAFFQDRARPETLKQLQHMGCDPFFRDYVRHPKWVELAEALVDERAQCEAPEWFDKPPLGPIRTPPHPTLPHRGGEGLSDRPSIVHATPPHQDNFYFCLKPPRVVTIWLALDAVDEKNGCLRYVTGSHLRGLRPHAPSAVLGFSQAITDYGPQDEEREAPIHLAPGDAVAHHGETIHRAEANRSTTRHRRAFAMVFQGEGCLRDEHAYARYQASLKTQQQSLGIGG